MRAAVITRYGSPDVIEIRRYPLEAIADAYRYVEQGQKTGIVVINVTPVNDSSL